MQESSDVERAPFIEQQDDSQTTQESSSKDRCCGCGYSNTILILMLIFGGLYLIELLSMIIVYFNQSAAKRVMMLTGQDNFNQLVIFMIIVYGIAVGLTVLFVGVRYCAKLNIKWSDSPQYFCYYFLACCGIGIILIVITAVIFAVSNNINFGILAFSFFFLSFCAPFCIMTTCCFTSHA